MTTAKEPLSCRREDYSLPSDLHYLNCAYMAPLPKAVEEAGIAGLRRKRDPSKVEPQHFFEESDALRARFARLVNLADPRRVAIVPSVSYGIATVARNTPIERSQNVVILGEQFPSNVYAWRRRVSEADAELRTVPAPESDVDRAVAWNQAVLEAIDSSTAAVALPHFHWSYGTRYDLAAIGERAREQGAALIVDATQSIGAYPFDVAELRPDALICAGYKTLQGPYSIGFAYFGERYDDGEPLEETWAARRDSQNFAGLVDYEDDYQGGAVRYDVGERSNWILIPMMAAALDLVLDWQVERIRDYCRTLTEDLFVTVQEMGFGVEDPAWRAGHLFGLVPPAGTDVETVREELARRRVMVSVRGRAVRVAPSVYNDTRDVEALLEALQASSRAGAAP